MTTQKKIKSLLTANTKNYAKTIAGLLNEIFELKDKMLFALIVCYLLKANIEKSKI